MKLAETTIVLTGHAKCPDLLEKLEEISSRKDLLPKSDLAQAVGNALNEFNAVCDIFKRGDTDLDNNYIERSTLHLPVKEKLPVLRVARGGEESLHTLLHRHLLQAEWHQLVRLHRRCP